MKFIKNIMKDRYGSDQLSFALFLVAMLFIILARFTKMQIFSLISNIPLIYGVYRMLSKDIYRRRLENNKYLTFVSPLKSKYRKSKRKFEGRKIYKYLVCPNCKKELRIPRGKGKINITCPQCKEKFEGRS